MGRRGYCRTRRTCRREKETVWISWGDMGERWPSESLRIILRLEERQGPRNSALNFFLPRPVGIFREAFPSAACTFVGDTSNFSVFVRLCNGSNLVSGNVAQLLIEGVGAGEMKMQQWLLSYPFTVHFPFSSSDTSHLMPARTLHVFQSSSSAAFCPTLVGFVGFVALGHLYC